MSDSVYKVIEVVGTSPKSWDAAAAAAVERVAAIAGQFVSDPVGRELFRAHQNCEGRALYKRVFGRMPRKIL